MATYALYRIIDQQSNTLFGRPKSTFFFWNSNTKQSKIFTVRVKAFRFLFLANAQSLVFSGASSYPK